MERCYLCYDGDEGVLHCTDTDYVNMRKNEESYQDWPCQDRETIYARVGLRVIGKYSEREDPFLTDTVKNKVRMMGNDYELTDEMNGAYLGKDGEVDGFAIEGGGSEALESDTFRNGLPTEVVIRTKKSYVSKYAREHGMINIELILSRKNLFENDLLHAETLEIANAAIQQYHPDIHPVDGKDFDMVCEFKGFIFNNDKFHPGKAYLLENWLKNICYYQDDPHHKLFLAWCEVIIDGWHREKKKQGADFKYKKIQTVCDDLKYYIGEYLEKTNHNTLGELPFQKISKVQMKINDDVLKYSQLTPVQSVNSECQVVKKEMLVIELDHNYNTTQLGGGVLDQRGIIPRHSNRKCKKKTGKYQCDRSGKIVSMVPYARQDSGYDTADSQKQKHVSSEKNRRLALRDGFLRLKNSINEQLQDGQSPLGEKASKMNILMAAKELINKLGELERKLEEERGVLEDESFWLKEKLSGL